MSRGASIPGPLSHPVVNVLAWALVATLALVGCTLLWGCARAACPACAPMLVCEEWPPPEVPSASASASSSAVPDWEPYPVPSGSAVP